LRILGAEVLRNLLVGYPPCADKLSRKQVESWQHQKRKMPCVNRNKCPLLYRVYTIYKKQKEKLKLLITRQPSDATNTAETPEILLYACPLQRVPLKPPKF
jgi:hypothetical protein